MGVKAEERRRKRSRRAGWPAGADRPPSGSRSGAHSSSFPTHHTPPEPCLLTANARRTFPFPANLDSIPSDAFLATRPAPTPLIGRSIHSLRSSPAAPARRGRETTLATKCTWLAVERLQLAWTWCSKVLSEPRWPPPLNSTRGRTACEQTTRINTRKCSTQIKQSGPRNGPEVYRTKWVQASYRALLPATGGGEVACDDALLTLPALPGRSLFALAALASL